MKTKTRNLLLFYLIQLICILGWDGFVLGYLALTKNNHIGITPILNEILPLLLSIGASFLLSSFIFPRKTSYTNALILSLPLAFIYILYYVVKPALEHSGLLSIWPSTYLAYALVIILFLLLNGLAIWVGSSFQKRKGANKKV